MKIKDAKDEAVSYLLNQVWQSLREVRIRPRFIHIDRARSKTELALIIKGVAIFLKSCSEDLMSIHDNISDTTKILK